MANGYKDRLCLGKKNPLLDEHYVTESTTAQTLHLDHRTVHCRMCGPSWDTLSLHVFHSDRSDRFVMSDSVGLCRSIAAMHIRKRGSPWIHVQARSHSVRSGILTICEGRLD